MKYLTYTNKGCIELCLNMLNSLERVGVAKQDIFIHCFDQESKDVLSSKEYNVFSGKFLDSNLQDYQEWSFDANSNFAKIVSWKWKIIALFYQKFGEVIFTDCDIVFKKNIEQDIVSYNKNICVQCDTPGTLYCTGFMYFKKSPEADLIIKECASNFMDDQLIFNKKVNDLKLTNKIHLLAKNLYPNGHVFYRTNIDKNQVYIIHNNHMIGLETKINAFKQYNNWSI